MSLERINIGSNIYISFVESDRFKQNLVMMNVISRLETGLKAAKSVVLDKVLKRGSVNYPTMADIDKRLAYLYAASVNVWSSKIGEAQIFSASAQMLENKYAWDGTDILNETLDVLADVLANPIVINGAFNKDYVETEKTNAINEILAQVNDKGWYTYKKCIETMCKGERFAIDTRGEVEDVEKITAANLYDHYKHILANSAIEIFCVGRLADKKQYLIDKFTELTGNFERSNAIEDYSTDVILKDQPKGEIIEEMEVNQGKLVMGFRTGMTNKDKDYANLILFNALYGASATSRLFENVRERLSLCYYCSSGIEAEKGIMTVQSGVEVENKQKAIDEIMRQLEEVKAGNFTDKEIDNAKMTIVNSYKGVYDGLGNISHWYLRQLIKGDVKTPEEMIDAVNKAGRDGIISAANRLSLDTTYFLKGTLLNSDSESEEE